MPRISARLIVISIHLRGTRTWHFVSTGLVVDSCGDGMHILFAMGARSFGAEPFTYQIRRRASDDMNPFLGPLAQNLGPSSDTSGCQKSSPDLKPHVGPES